MSTITVSHFRNHLGEHLEAVRSEPVVITSRGRRKAVLVSPETYDNAIRSTRPTPPPEVYLTWGHSEFLEAFGPGYRKTPEFKAALRAAIEEINELDKNDDTLDFFAPIQCWGD